MGAVAIATAATGEDGTACTISKFMTVTTWERIEEQSRGAQERQRRWLSFEMQNDACSEVVVVLISLVDGVYVRACGMHRLIWGGLSLG